MSTLLEQWRDTAYSKEMDKASLQKFWGTYFQTEKEIYEKLLENPDEEVKGTVKELAEKYGINVFTMTGFLDGINDSLKVPNPIETMDEDTKVKIEIDPEKLYYNMVEAKATWLEPASQELRLYPGFSDSPISGLRSGSCESAFIKTTALSPQYSPSPVRTAEAAQEYRQI